MSEPTEPTEPTELRSAKATIRALWRDEIDGADEIELPDVAAKITESLKNDSEFLKSFASELLPGVVYDAGQRMLASERSLVRTGLTYANPEAIRKSIRDEITSNFSSWMEYVPGEKKNIAFPEMTKEQVLDAARHRIKRGSDEVETGEWLRLVAGKMKDGQIVRDVWRDDQLVMLKKQITVKVTTGLTTTKPPAIAAD